MVKRALLGVLLVAGLAPPAVAGDGAELLDQARQAIENIDYEAARKHVTAALDGGGLTLEEHRRARRLAGEIEAALGSPDAARDHFAVWLAIDPGAALPSGLSPKITEPFEQAKAAGARLDISISLARETDGVRVRLEVTDPRSLVHGFEVRGGGAQAVGTGGSALLETTDPGAIQVTVEIVDDRTNQVAVRTATVAAVTAAEPPPRTSRKGFPTALRWPTWAGVAVVVAGTGAYFTYRVGQAEDDLTALNADPGNHTADEAQAIIDRGERDATIANVLYGVAGAAALAAVLTFVLEPDDDVEVRPAAGPGGASVTATIRF